MFCKFICLFTDYSANGRIFPHFSHESAERLCTAAASQPALWHALPSHAAWNSLSFRFASSSRCSGT